MTIHPITLSFTGKWRHLEKEYQEAHYEKSLWHIRIAILIAIFVYASFGVLDAYISPENKHIFWFIRYAVACPFAFCVFLFSFTRHFKKYGNISMFAMFLIAGLGIDCMILLADPPATHSYYTGVLLILIYLYTFLRIRFIWAVAASWLMVLFYEAIALWWIETPAIMLINNTFFIVTGNIFCMMGGYVIETGLRRSFLLNHMLSIEKETVAGRNRELADRIQRQQRAEQALKEKNREIAAIVRKRTRQLKESREKYRDLVEQINDVIYAVDNTGVVTYINPVVRNMLGYDPSEVIGRIFTDFLHPGDVERVMDQFVRDLVGRTAPIEFRVRAASGEYLWVVASSRPAHEPDGDVGLRGVLRDITGVKVLEEQLRHALKMEAVGTLAGGVAHDFNNILSIIIGNVELAGDDLPADAPARTYLSQARTSCLRARDVVQQLLSFGRKDESHKVAIDLCEVVEECIKLLRASIPTTIEIRRDLQKLPGAVPADPVKVNQALINLCANAALAMEQTGGVLEILLKTVDFEKAGPEPGLAPGRYARLTVRDSGPGIDPAVLDRIFDPYFTTREVGRGSGMGLAVVHGIARDHDGAVTVENAPDKGAAFHLYFPLTDRDPAAPPPMPPEPPGGTECILFVDDEPSIAAACASVLEGLGYTVLTRTDPREALALFAADPGRFDLVVTDMTMPGMTGDRLATALMNIRPDLAVVLCTGFTRAITREQALGLGIRAFAHKPLDRAGLAELVRAALDGR